MPNYGGESSGGSDLGGGNYSGGGGYSGSGGGRDDRNDYSSDIARALAQAAKTSASPGPTPAEQAAAAGGDPTSGFESYDADYGFDTLANALAGQASAERSGAENTETSWGFTEGGEPGSYDFKKAFKMGSLGAKAGGFFGGPGSLIGMLLGLASGYSPATAGMVPDSIAPSLGGISFNNADGSSGGLPGFGGGGDAPGGGGVDDGIPVTGGTVSPTGYAGGGTPAAITGANPLRFGGDQSLQLYRERLGEDNNSILGADYVDELNKFTKSLF